MRVPALTLAAAALLVWCVAAATSGLVKARSHAPDARAALEADLAVLGSRIPADAAVGYLEAGEGDDTALHIAQYALVPRLVTRGAGPAFLIVHGAHAGGETGLPLAGYEPVGESTGSSHRLYRRIR